MKEIKKTAFGVIAFVLLLIAADWAVGSWSEMMYYKSKYGMYHRQIYSLQESKDDILILGSSRAAHHYVPQIFEDSLGMTCYNAGSDGMCIYYHYAILASRIYRCCAPKLVVLEVMPEDVVISGGATFTLDAALVRLAPHYGEFPAIDSLFALNGWKEKLKQNSITYRHNSKLVQTIKSNYCYSTEDHGYEALIGEMEVSEGNAVDALVPAKELEMEENKVVYLLKLITLCKTNGISLVMCYSPYFGSSQSSSIEMIKQMAKDADVLFLDYSKDEEYQKPEYFNDASHLNDVGARVYSRDIVKHLSI